MKLKIYTDGASKGGGPPGHSAIAYIILTHEDKLLERHSEYIGVKTNNQAEYEALITALHAALYFGNIATCYSDSALIIKQLNGQWDIHDLKMRKLWREVISIKKEFKKILFIHVPRTDPYIQQVDRMAKKILNEM